jgi:hypothetical protein
VLGDQGQSLLEGLVAGEAGDEHLERLRAAVGVSHDMGDLVLEHCLGARRREAEVARYQEVAVRDHEVRNVVAELHDGG